MSAFAVTDEHSKRRPRDANRVNIHEHWEVDYWCRQFKCTRAQLIVTVHTVGPMVDTVGRFLRELLRPSPHVIPMRAVPPPAAPEQPPSPNR